MCSNQSQVRASDRVYLLAGLGPLAFALLLVIVRADPATSHFVPSFLSEVTDLSLRIGTEILP